MAERNYLRNYWYVAATSAEVTRQPMRRWLCNEPVVLFRRQDGTPAALNDRCPHRKFPLSAGVMVGDDIQCNYHGARFSGDGSCTVIHGEKRIAPGFRATSYPVLEKYKLVWIWMGDAEKRDESLIPADWELNDHPDWTTVFGYHHVKGNYLLMLDNVLDLTHVAYVHPTTLSSPQVFDAPNKVEIEGDEIRSLRITYNADTPPLFKAAKGLGSKIDRWQKLHFTLPSNMLGDMRGYPPGTNDINEAFRYCVLNSFTPETDGSCHYFWSVARMFARDDDSISRLLQEGVTKAFDEDCGVIVKQQEMVETDKSGTPMANFKADEGGLAMRRIIARKLTEEVGGKIRT